MKSYKALQHNYVVSFTVIYRASTPGPVKASKCAVEILAFTGVLAREIMNVRTNVYVHLRHDVTKSECYHWNNFDIYFIHVYI